MQASTTPCSQWGKEAVLVVGGDAMHGAFFEALAALLGAAMAREGSV